MDDTFDNWLRERDPTGVDDDGRLVAGTIIGDYKIVALLGRGGFAEVYRAVSSADEHVAIKILHRLDDKSRLRFEREAKILSQINHPNAPRLLGFGSFGNRPYLVTELLHTNELPHADRAIAKFVRKVCAAVAALHEMGYVHRDIKPSNILWRGDEPVLIDYGLACPFSDGKSPPSTLSIVDGNRILVGTVGYAAPEQFAGGKIDASTDIHAIGMMVNACFEDRPPRRWKKIIDRATNSRNNARYTTVRELARAVSRRYFGVFGWVVVGIPLLWFVVSVATVSIVVYHLNKYANLENEIGDELDRMLGCFLKSHQPRVVDRALYVPDDLTTDEVAELNGDDWCKILRRRPELYKKVPFNKLHDRIKGQLVVNVPDLMLNAKEVLQGASWDVWLNVLMADPEQACNCDFTRPCGMLKQEMWGDIFLAFPKFVDKCDFTGLESNAIKDILMKNPHLVDRLDLSKLSGYAWSDVLLAYPEFERYCDFARLSGHAWASILEKTSRYDDRCDFSLLNGSDWKELLEKSTRYDGRCDYQKLNGGQWVALLSCTTRFDEICDYKKFSARDWGKLLSVRPKLAIRCEKTFSRKDAIEFLRECPRLVEKCDLTHMSAQEWGSLLKDNPQMIDRWSYGEYGDKEWHDFSFAYFSRDDGGQLCRDKVSALKLTPESRQKLEKYIVVPSDEQTRRQSELKDLLACAKNGDGTAMWKLGLWYEGQVDHDDKKAYEWYEKGTAAKNPLCMGKLGDCFFSGLGVERNIAKAVEYYRMAWKHNDPYGTFRLGECYEQGIGVEGKDEGRALGLYRKSAKSVSSSDWFAKQLFYRLGHSYENGIGIAIDRREAKWWYGKAKAAGCEVSKERIEIMDKDEKAARKGGK